MLKALPVHDRSVVNYQPCLLSCLKWHEAACVSASDSCIQCCCRITLLPLITSTTARRPCAANVLPHRLCHPSLPLQAARMVFLASSDGVSSTASQKTATYRVHGLLPHHQSHSGTVVLPYTCLNVVADLLTQCIVRAYHQVHQTSPGT